MLKKIIEKIIGTANERTIKKLRSAIQAINAFEPQMASLSDEALKNKTTEFKERLKNGANMDDILLEAFAVVREAGKRTLNMRHFDVQLLGGIILHTGRITEMKTGEGKTLVATLPVYLNALEGKGVHVVTVNDYLANRDAEWMGQIYNFLGLSVGVIQHDMSKENRRIAYHCDITYGTNNEFGFDYLRDNMEFDADNLVQREFNFAIVDEVDSILIDEARTPLIISGPTGESTSFYYTVNNFVKSIKHDKTNYEHDEKHKTVVLTEKGISEAERFFKTENLYDLKNMEILHQIYQSLKAHLIFNLDVDYLLKDGQVVIVDEFTGRMMPGRRFSDGLHQALEAKENVRIEQESQTYATITFQNLFRMYKKLAGMTGTAITEAQEFRSIYGLDVVDIPTNRPMIRKEFPDMIFGTKEEKWQAVTQEIRELHEKGQPVLVGTISIENSEFLSRQLRKEKIPHVVLNAKYHEMEAEIVAQAGRVGSVTIATNMAGRGTDILLGGNANYLLRENLKKKNFTLESAPEPVLESLKKEATELTDSAHNKVVQLGGLHILGTERHEARRIDNQLRGRSGRQGDPGSSRFYISLEDDLMKILGSDRIRGILQRFGMNSGIPIENSFVSRAIENAQKQIESHNFEIRKHLLKYDDVMNVQRTFVYNWRRDILNGKDFRETVFQLIEDLFIDMFEYHMDPKKPAEEREFDALQKEMKAQFGIDPLPLLTGKPEDIAIPDLQELLLNHLKEFYSAKESRLGSNFLREIERHIMLQIIDNQWKDHLLNLDHLKEGIGLRGYAQKDPLIEYKKESFNLFEAMRSRADEEIIRFLFLFQPVEDDQMEQLKKKSVVKPHKPSSKMPGAGKKKRK